MNSSYEWSAEGVVRVHIAAQKLDCSTRTVIRRIRRGQIPATRIGRRAWGIRVSDLQGKRCDKGRLS
jgi:excisionase family DNA binding protein